jgi:hypothetical protein
VDDITYSAVLEAGHRDESPAKKHYDRNLAAGSAYALHTFGLYTPGRFTLGYSLSAMREHGGAYARIEVIKGGNQRVLFQELNLLGPDGGDSSSGGGVLSGVLEPDAYKIEISVSSGNGRRVGGIFPDFASGRGNARASLSLAIETSTAVRWTSGTDGAFGTSARWADGIGVNRVPGAGDQARFDADSAYTVSFGGAAATKSLNVAAGDVTFDMGGHTWNLASRGAVGGTDGAGALRVRGGRVSALTGGVTGRLSLDHDATWESRLAHVQHPGATLEVEVKNENNLGRLTSPQSVTVGGELKVRLAPDHAAKPSARYPVVDAASLQGTFSNPNDVVTFDRPGAPEGARKASFEINYAAAPGAVTLENYSSGVAHVLTAGVNSRSQATPLEADGGASAATVDAAFFPLLNLAAGDTAPGAVNLNASESGNKQRLLNRIDAIAAAPSLRHGDTVFIYLTGHGLGLIENGPERPVPTRVDPQSTVTATSSANEVIKLGGGERISDDELAQAIRGGKWDEVYKVFLIDACYSGGFWDGGDGKDLSSLPRSAMIASATESDIALYDVGSGQTVFSKAVANAMIGVGSLEGLTWDDLLLRIATEYEQPSVVGSVLGIEEFYGQEFTHSPHLFAAATDDFRLGTSVPEPSGVAVVLVGITAQCARRRRAC